jgi:uncharacterized membrane protein
VPAPPTDHTGVVATTRRLPESADLLGPGTQIGLLAASSIVPETFAPSLTPRSWLDQGIVTGFATGLDYLLTTLARDGLDAVRAATVSALPAGAVASRLVRPPADHLFVDFAAASAGLAVLAAMRRRPDDSTVRGALRQVAWRTARTGACGLILTGLTTGAQALDSLVGADGRISRIPPSVPAGLAIALLRDRVRHAPLSADQHTVPPALPSIAASAGVVGALAGFAALEHAAAGAAATALARVLPGPEPVWRLAGHAAFLGLVVAAGSALLDRIVRGLEAGETAFEPILTESVEPGWIGPTVSGGPGSRVPWATLGREGRRHAFAHVRPAPVEHRPPGVPDLSIPTVMGQAARAAPIQVYVGLDSAQDARARVELALAELDRTGAWDRSLLVLISPTGTGYVNYGAVAAIQYLTLGDVATVTLQYSKRPSALSLGRIGAAREQNRLLLLQVMDRLRAVPPARRPRVVLFGESLGAHTSQDVLLHWGTLGPKALGVDRALWIGTPYGSKWMHQVTGAPRPDVDPDLVGVFNDFDQYAALPAERRTRLRYVMVSHDNDGVTKFGPDLVFNRPRWLEPGRPAVQEIPGASPRGVPAGMRWRPLTTFLQTMIDMKNAQAPWGYRAFAHDYRPDLARFVSAVFALPASDEQMARIETALEERDQVGEQLFGSWSVSQPSPRVGPEGDARPAAHPMRARRSTPRRSRAR